MDRSWIIELYRTGSLTTVRVERVKHAWLDDDGRVLVIAQYISGVSGAHRYMVWRTCHIDWYRMVRTADAEEGR